MIAVATLKGAVLLLVTIAALGPFGRSPAQFRARLWTLAILGHLVLLAPLPRGIGVPIRTPLAMPGATAWHGSASVATRGDDRLPTASPQDAVRSSGLPGAASIDWKMRAAGAASLIWVVGMVLLCTRLVIGHIALERIRRRARPVLSRRVSGIARRAAAEIGLEQTPQVLMDPALPVPSAFPLGRTVLLPVDADTWGSNRIRMVLLHEFEHLLRQDGLRLAAAHCIRALFWPSPLIWFAVHRLRAECETACDERVLSCGVPASDYVLTLVDVARRSRVGSYTPAALASLVSVSGLEARARRILNAKSRRARRAAGAVATLTLVGCTIGIAGVRADPPSASLEVRLAALPSGRVAFWFVPRRHVCGVGESVHVITELPGQYREQECGPQRVDVTLDRVNGETVGLAARVVDATDPPPEGTIIWGAVGAPEASRFLLALATASADPVASSAILPAVVADSTDVWPGLLALAHDHGRPPAARLRALYWLRRETAAPVIASLVTILMDEGDDLEFRRRVVHTIAQRNPAEAVSALERVAAELQHAELRGTVSSVLASIVDERYEP